MVDLSIITVTFNDADGLNSTYQSLAGQSDPEFEWIVVDGASTDGTAELLDRISKAEKPEAIRVLSEPDNGIYDAMNKGIGLAGGQYALFLNAGDTLDSDDTVAALSRAISENRTDPEEKQPVLYGSYKRIMPGGRLLHSAAKEPGYIYHSLPTSHQAILYPTGFLKDNRYDLRYRISGDYYITCKAFMLEHPLRRIDVTVSRFRTGGTASQNTRHVVGDAARIQRDVLKMRMPAVLKSMVRRYINIRVIRYVHKRRPGSALLQSLIDRMSRAKHGL